MSHTSERWIFLKNTICMSLVIISEAFEVSITKIFIYFLEKFNNALFIILKLWNVSGSEMHYTA